MILLSNGHKLERVLPSGTMGFDCKGWWWERPLVWAGLIRLELFTTFFRTLTKPPRPYPVSNLSWARPWTWLPFSPWSCVRTISGGSVNKINFWSPGFEYWRQCIAPTMDFEGQEIGGSIYGDGDELAEMAEGLNAYGLAALEVNDSCPNTGKDFKNTETVVANVKRIAKVSRHPLIVKVSIAQDYLAIAAELAGIAQAISLNSVPWDIAFPARQSPMAGIGGNQGKGGVSGQPAQRCNWTAVKDLVQQGTLPVIAPSIMTFEDVVYVTDTLGAKAWSGGAIHLPSHPVWLKPWTIFTNPCKATAIARKDMARHRGNPVPAAAC